MPKPKQPNAALDALTLYLDLKIDTALAVPPSYRQSLLNAKKHLAKTRFAIETAEMIAKGGSPVPEELR